MTRMQIYDLLMRINDGYVPSAEERRELQEVQSLDLSYTYIKELPEPVSELKNLQELNLNETDITELPKSVGELENLQELYLGGTSITKLPKSVGELKNLQRLGLSSTSITKLPESVGELKNLRSLDLSFTNITELPEWLGNLPKLRELDLSNLTLERIPRSLAMSGMKFIDSYNEWLKTDGVYVYNLTLTEQDLSVFINTPELIPTLYESGDDIITVHESKVIFLGDGEAGKSYTIQRFLNGGKKETEDNPYKTSETPGIEIVDYRVERGEDSFNIHFWDFGGQLILHSMHRCFLTDKTCYVVMVKTRETKSTQRARYWLRNVTSFAPNSPILLYVNCWDNDDGKRAIDESGILRDYPNVKDVVYCSSKQAEDGDFREFMDKLTDMASASVEAREKVPRRWNNLRTALTRENTDYLTKKRYYELCADNEIKDADAAPLLTFFNNLGVCFSYHRDREKRELADYKLLNPVWLTNAIYAIIEEGMAGAIEGRIGRGIVEQMLKNAAPEDIRGKKYRRTMPDIIYEPNECGYVTDVAAAHDLCYKIDDDTLFFPALCTNNTPVEELDDVADYPQHLEYQLKYTYLPDSVVHQLMIRCLRRELVLKNCWLRGMVLGSMEMYKAFVRMDDDDETLKIDIYSKAGHPAYELFKILRDEITEINNKLGFRGIREYIVKGEDRFTVAALLNASKGTDVVYGDSGKSYEASELLGRFYDEWTVSNMNVIEGMIYIPIRKIDYHKCSKSYEPLRQALWEVYKRRCQVCHKPLPYESMEVDHIFPTKWDRNDDSAAKYAEVLRQQGMDTDKPDFVENYLPTHGHCNLAKNNHVDILLTMERHRIALNNTEKVLAEMAKREKQ